MHSLQPKYERAHNLLLSIWASCISTTLHACRHDYGVRNYVAAAQHLATAQQEGLCQHIGVTNFDVPRLKEMLDAGVRIVSNQARKGCGLTTCSAPCYPHRFCIQSRDTYVHNQFQLNGNLLYMQVALTHVTCQA